MPRTSMFLEIKFDLKKCKSQLIISPFPMICRKFDLISVLKLFLTLRFVVMYLSIFFLYKLYNIFMQLMLSHLTNLYWVCT